MCNVHIIYYIHNIIILCRAPERCCGGGGDRYSIITEYNIIYCTATTARRRTVIRLVTLFIPSVLAHTRYPVTCTRASRVRRCRYIPAALCTMYHGQSFWCCRKADFRLWSRLACNLRFTTIIIMRLKIFPRPVSFSFNVRTLQVHKKESRNNNYYYHSYSLKIHNNIMSETITVSKCTQHGGVLP